MSAYTIDELIDRWNRGQFAEVQIITHMLQALLEHELRLTALERRLEPPKGNGAEPRNGTGKGSQ